jgi:2-iminoacetate synthase ThiH
VKLNKDDKELYYLENDKVVFTSEYHLQRGNCCGNRCRHCPYVPKYIKGNTNIKQKQNGNS